MNFLRLASIALIGGFIMPGHAAAPTASGYLSDYDRLQEGEYLEAYWVDIVQIKKSAAPTMLLGEISVTGIKNHKGVTVADCVSWLKADLLAMTVFSGSQSEAKYRLDLAVTHMDPGSAVKRIWAGEFGAGHAQLQIEGKVVDIESGKVMAAFAERRRSSGAIGAKDFSWRRWATHNRAPGQFDKRRCRK